MKTIKHNLIGLFLICTAIAFGQKQEKTYSESFSVNSDVVIEINASYTDVKIEEWNKNEVSINGVLEIEGVTKEEASEYFEGWTLESLGNKSKVVIESQPNGFHHYAFMGDYDFDFDFDNDLDFDFEFGSVINAAIAPVIEFDSAFINFPDMPAPVMKNIAEIEFDHDAYEKDKEKYMAEYEKRVEEWEKDFEKNYAPQMEEYEKKMEAWAAEYEKSIEPRMEEFEKKMEVWEKEFEEKMAPQLEAYEKKMEKQAKVMEEKAEKLEKKAEEHEKKIEKMHADKMKMKKKLVIKVPKNAVVKLNVHHGTIDIPDTVKKQ